MMNFIFLSAALVLGASVGFFLGAMVSSVPFIFLTYSGQTDTGVMLLVAGIVVGVLVCGLGLGWLAYKTRTRVTPKVKLLTSVTILLIVGGFWLSRWLIILNRETNLQQEVIDQVQLSSSEHVVTGIQMEAGGNAAQVLQVNIFTQGETAATYRLRYRVIDRAYRLSHFTGEKLVNLPSGESQAVIEIDQKALASTYLSQIVNVPQSQAQISVDEVFDLELVLLPVDTQISDEHLEIVVGSLIPKYMFDMPIQFAINNGQLSF